MLQDCHLLIGYVLLVLGLSEAAFLPDYEYIEGVGWLRLHIVPASWPDAQLRCHLEDATLTAPTTSAITAVMKTTMRAHRLAEGTVFTDIYASNPKGEFTSINGLPMSNITLQWAVGEPNNLGNEEDCLVMTGAGELADVSCSSVHPFFCLKRNTTSKRDECETIYIANECNSTFDTNQSNTTYNENECNCTIEASQCNTTQEANQCVTTYNEHECNSTIIILNECNNTLEANQIDTTLEANPCNTAYNENECNCTIEANQGNTNQEAKQCDTTAEGYTLEPRTGSCYKFHRIAIPWRRAAMKCAVERAHLAVINSDEEAQVIKELFNQNPPSTIMFAKDDYYAHIGILDWNEGEQWLTVFGETLDEAGYNTWDNGEPNHLNGSEYCGSVSSFGKLNDSPCSLENLAYICEISPKLQ